MGQAAGRHHGHASDAVEAFDRTVQGAAQIEASTVLGDVMRKVNIQNDRDAGRRRVTQNRVIEKPVCVRNAPARRCLRCRIGLRKIEILAGKKIQYVIGKSRRAGIGGACQR